MGTCTDEYHKEICLSKRIESEDYIYRNCKNVSFFSIEEYIKNEFNRMYPNHNLYRLDFPISRPVLDATIVEKNMMWYFGQG